MALITNIVQDKVQLYEQYMDAKLIPEKPDSQAKSLDVHHLFLSSMWHLTTILFH